MSLFRRRRIRARDFPAVAEQLAVTLFDNRATLCPSAVAVLEELPSSLQVRRRSFSPDVEGAIAALQLLWVCLQIGEAQYLKGKECQEFSGALVGCMIGDMKSLEPFQEVYAMWVDAASNQDGSLSRNFVDMLAIDIVGERQWCGLEDLPSFAGVQVGFSHLLLAQMTLVKAATALAFRDEEGAQRIMDEYEEHERRNLS